MHPANTRGHRWHACRIRAAFKSNRGSIYRREKSASGRAAFTVAFWNVLFHMFVCECVHFIVNSAHVSCHAFNVTCMVHVRTNQFHAERINHLNFKDITVITRLGWMVIRYLTPN